MTFRFGSYLKYEEFNGINDGNTFSSWLVFLLSMKWNLNLCFKGCNMISIGNLIGCQLGSSSKTGDWVFAVGKPALMSVKLP